MKYTFLKLCAVFIFIIPSLSFAKTSTATSANQNSFPSTPPLPSSIPMVYTDSNRALKTPVFSINHKTNTTFIIEA